MKWFLYYKDPAKLVLVFSLLLILNATAKTLATTLGAQKMSCI